VIITAAEAVPETYFSSLQGKKSILVMAYERMQTATHRNSITKPVKSHPGRYVGGWTRDNDLLNHGTRMTSSTSKWKGLSQYAQIEVISYIMVD
jgi:hypothetical protein